MRSPPSNGEFKFCSQEGRTLILKLLSSKIPYRPHDYVLDGVAKSLDGVHLLAVSGTGSGKTGFYAFYMLVLQALDRNRTLYPLAARKVPKNPAMVLILPTMGLEDEMVSSILVRQV